METIIEGPELDQRFVAAMAAKIRREYIEQKGRIFGNNAGRIGKRHDKQSNWKRAAEQCLRLKADPESYVRACFMFCEMSTGPFANMLGGAAAKTWYNKFQNLITKDGTKKGDADESVGQAVDREGLSRQITSAREAMVRLTGTYAPIPENIDWICRWTTQIQPHVKVLLAYPDARAIERFGAEALEIFLGNPNVVASARKLGYPIDDVLLCLTKKN